MTPAVRIAALAGLVLTGVGAGAWFRAGHGVPAAARAAMRVPVGEASPPIPSDFDPAGATMQAGIDESATIPAHLPEFSLSDTRGKPVRIAHWAGKSLVLNFWATWCAPCRREIPLLQSLAGEWQGRNVEVVGIAVDYPDKVRTYANELKIAYPLLVGEQDALDVAAQFGVQSPVFPFTVFTDRHGEVVTLFVGELHKPQADLILSVLQSVNENQLQLPAARRAIADGLNALRPEQAG